MICFFLLYDGHVVAADPSGQGAGADLVPGRSGGVFIGRNVLHGLALRQRAQDLGLGIGFRTDVQVRGGLYRADGGLILGEILGRSVTGLAVRGLDMIPLGAVRCGLGTQVDNFGALLDHCLYFLLYCHHRKPYANG